MTVLEMTYEFNKLLSLIDSDLYANQKPTESTVISMLNISQERLFRDRYLSNGDSANVRDIFNRFDSELSSMFVPSNQTLTVSDASRGKYTFGNLMTIVNNGVAGVISVMLNTTGGVNHTTSGMVNCVYKTPIEFNRITNSPVNVSILPSPIFTIEGLSLVVAIDKYTTTNASCYMELLCYPLYMTLKTPSGSQTNTCQLARFLHEEVVKQAVELYLLDLKSYTKPKE